MPAVALLVQAAGGAASGDPNATGALEAAAGLWARCFAAATMTPEIEVLTPSLMATIARALIRRGEIIFEIDVSDGRLVLHPVGDYDVRGDVDPASWAYRVRSPWAVAHEHEIVRRRCRAPFPLCDRAKPAVEGRRAVGLGAPAGRACRQRRDAAGSRGRRHRRPSAADADRWRRRHGRGPEQDAEGRPREGFRAAAFCRDDLGRFWRRPHRRAQSRLATEANRADAG